MRNVSFAHMILKFYKGHYYIKCHANDNELMRKLGLRHVKESGHWVTPFSFVANKLKKYLDKMEIPNYLRELEFGLEAEKNRFEMSRALHSSRLDPYHLHPPGLTLRPYQRAGIHYCIDLKGALLADDMGVGKTIQAIGIVNHMMPEKVLIVCPASVKLNWAKELDKWLVEKRRVGVAKGSHWPLGADTVIINYDILSKHRAMIRSIDWGMVVLDEAQYLKNPTAMRTMEICGGASQRKGIYLPPLPAKFKLALTGTPILNKPIEIFTILRYLDPTGWHDRMAFARRYCAAYKSVYGWDMSGASNLEELQYRLRSTLMCRRLKCDVLTELPPKVRQVIEIDPESRHKKALKREQGLWSDIKDKSGITDNTILDDDKFRMVVKLMRDGTFGKDEHIATIRREVAISKIPDIISHLDTVLENEHKVVCFVHHREVVKGLKERYKDECVVVDGSTNERNRLTAVERFQNYGNVRLFFGNIKSAGVGITLTAASVVVFGESDWTPGLITQAEDRIHRIGQKSQALIHHLVLAGSMDAIMVKRVIHKQDIIERALNDTSGVNSGIEELLE